LKQEQVVVAVVVAQCYGQHISVGMERKRIERASDDGRPPGLVAAAETDNDVDDDNDARKV